MKLKKDYKLIIMYNSTFNMVRCRSSVLHYLLCFSIICSVMVPFQLQAQSAQDEMIIIGSKLFTESVILGEIATQLAEHGDIETDYYSQLGGTRILWNALREGDIDAYPDYTGTLIQEIIQDSSIQHMDELRQRLVKFNVEITQPLGFNNTYALGMREKHAKRLGIETISDLRNHPELKHGYSNEFMNRGDGWKGLREIYQLSPDEVTGLDHDLAYRGLESGGIDVIDLYSTDAEIDYYNLKVLEDDLHFFPEYQAVFVYRSELKDKSPTAVKVLNQMAGTIPEPQMINMNARVKLDQIPAQEVASDFIRHTFDIETEVKATGLWQRLWVNTLDHLYLVGISLGLAILIAIPLGIIAVKVPVIENTVLGVVGVLQTIPSLALLVFMIPLFGIGALPAMAALFLYSLLPVVRNTHSGIKNIPTPTMESAYALGLPKTVVLKKIELPLAMPTILAGIKTSAVINVGTATLGALIGAGGYGQPILTGIRLDSVPLILEGAIPAALLALAVQGLFDLIEKQLSN